MHLEVLSKHGSALSPSGIDSGKAVVRRVGEIGMKERQVFTQLPEAGIEGTGAFIILPQAVLPPHVHPIAYDECGAGKEICTLC